MLPLIYDEGLARRQSIGVQQSPTALSACTQIVTANGTAQQTITVTPPAGQFFCLCALDLHYCASGSAATATPLVTTTTTGFSGNPKGLISVSNTAPVCFPTGNKRLAADLLWHRAPAALRVRVWAIMSRGSGQTRVPAAGGR